MTELNNKQKLRQKCREIRDSFGENLIERASLDACSLFLQTEEFKQADTIFLYYPIKNEISVLPIIREAKKMGKKIAFPICYTKNNTLCFRIIDSISELSPSHFGISEPPPTNEAPSPTKSSVALIPGLAFSKNGHRIGYGKGYYDRFLQDFKGISIGFTYSKLLLDYIPHDLHDIPLKMLITESEVLYFD